MNNWHDSSKKGLGLSLKYSRKVKNNDCDVLSKKEPRKSTLSGPNVHCGSISFIYLFQSCHLTLMPYTTKPSEWKCSLFASNLTSPFLHTWCISIVVEFRMIKDKKTMNIKDLCITERKISKDKWCELIASEQSYRVI